MERVRKYLDLMVYVLKADGIVHEKERALLDALIINVGLKDEIIEEYKAKLEEGSVPDMEKRLTELAENVDAQALAGMVRDAYLMADADGIIDPTEVNLINSFLSKAGIPEERHKEIEMWGRETIAHMKRGILLLEKPELL